MDEQEERRAYQRKGRSDPSELVDDSYVRPRPLDTSAPATWRLPRCESVALLEACGGAELWVKQLTAVRRVSIWTNKPQVNEDAMRPSRNRTPVGCVDPMGSHSNVAGAPSGSQFVFFETKKSALCGTESCQDALEVVRPTTSWPRDVRLDVYTCRGRCADLRVIPTMRTPH